MTNEVELWGPSSRDVTPDGPGNRDLWGRQALKSQGRQCQRPGEWSLCLSLFLARPPGPVTEVFAPVLFICKIGISLLTGGSQITYVHSVHLKVLPGGRRFPEVTYENHRP